MKNYQELLKRKDEFIGKSIRHGQFTYTISDILVDQDDCVTFKGRANSYDFGINKDWISFSEFDDGILEVYGHSMHFVIK